MADPDIRRMGKKHKKHKKDHSQLHNVRLPGKLLVAVKYCVKLFGGKGQRGGVCAYVYYYGALYFGITLQASYPSEFLCRRSP